MMTAVNIKQCDLNEGILSRPQICFLMFSTMTSNCSEAVFGLFITLTCLSSNSKRSQFRKRKILHHFLCTWPWSWFNLRRSSYWPMLVSSGHYFSYFSVLSFLGWQDAELSPTNIPSLMCLLRFTGAQSLVTVVTQWLSVNNFRLPGKALHDLTCHLPSHLCLTPEPK